MAETVTHRTNRKIKHEVVENCWKYLKDNFHKFSESNKIKVALTLTQKDMATILEGEFTATVKMPSITIDDKPVEFKIGK